MNQSGIITSTLDRDGLEALCRRGLERATGLGQPVLVSLTVPYAGENDPLVLFSKSGQTAAKRWFWYRPRQGFWLVGRGTAVEPTGTTVGPTEAIKRRHAELLAMAVTEGPDGEGSGPVFFGGFRYDPLTPPDPVWQGFPAASFTLPRFLFSHSDGRRRLTVNALVNGDSDVQALTESILFDLHGIETAHSIMPAQPALIETIEDSRDEWRRRVTAALKRIEAGSLSKVVLARRRILKADSNFSPEAALACLSRAYPSCAVFAADSGDGVFLGASPEGLASVTGGRLSVACLASSAPRGTTPDEDAMYRHYLIEDGKERREHAAVVGMLADALRDVCRELRWPEEPQVMKLKNIQHLYTPFTGRLEPGVPILDIVKRLHPTPAVGGVPVAPALELIRELEGDRGWYAAPVGWFDREGDGDFVVAIRSALLRDDTAYLYAGCGIVAGSEPDREYDETELKFQPLLAALAPER